MNWLLPRYYHLSQDLAHESSTRRCFGTAEICNGLVVALIHLPYWAIHSMRSGSYHTDRAFEWPSCILKAEAVQKR